MADSINIDDIQYNVVGVNVAQRNHIPVPVNPQTINEKIQTLLGGRLTKKWVLDTYLSPIYEAKTFGQLRQRTQEALHELENLGAFDKVSITIDEPTTKTGGNANSAIDVVINVDILEKKKLSGQSGVESTPGMSELGLVAKLKLDNFFGGVESFQYQYNIDSKKDTHVQASFYKPLLWLKGSKSVSVDVSNDHTDNTDIASHKLDSKGGSIKYRNGQHAFQYEWSWRHVQLMGNPTEPILLEGGHSVKSSVKHTWTQDKRNHPSLPTEGHAARVSTEVAGVGGDVAFVKQEVDAQISYPLFENWGVTLNSRAGFIAPLFGTKTRITDRFLSGGPANLRGFEVGGVGPRIAHDSLGGELQWGASAHLTNFAYEGGLGRLSLQIFGQLGNNVRFLNEWRSLFARNGENATRASIGVGGVFGMHSGPKLEVNYVMPVSYRPRDRQSGAVQFGISADFM